MKKTLISVFIALFFTACTSSPNFDPERTSAKALQDQAKTLDSINQQLKRIADALEKK